MQRSRSIDSVRPPVRHSNTLQQPVARRASTVDRTPAARPKKSRPAHATYQAWLKKWFKPAVLSIVFLVIIAAAIVYQTAAELIIIMYGIVAFFKRIPSRLTFVIALVTLFCTPIAGLLNYKEFAVTAASYAFLFLMIGTICLARELSRHSGNSA